MFCFSYKIDVWEMYKKLGRINFINRIDVAAITKNDRARVMNTAIIDKFWFGVIATK